MVVTGASNGVVETHASTLVFLGNRVYKLRKTVDLGFLDLRERSVREAACHAEVELNRRLAPDVYLGVADVLGPDGAPCEHLVVMRRLPDDRKLARLIQGGPSMDAELRTLARLIADFHRCAARSEQITGWGGRDAVRALWSEGLTGLRAAMDGVLDETQVERTGTLAYRYLEGRGPLFAERQSSGRIVDGHGDLLADDIFLLPDGPRVLDCLEFDPRLRAGDVLADVAFLSMDLERLGAPGAARLFLDAYQAVSAERHPRSLEDHYIGYRAHVRAKVACLRAGQGDPASADEARQLIGICERHLDRARVRLVLVGGPPGSGKSTVAGLLARRTGWPVVSSDAVRKELAGLDANRPAPSPFQAGIYSPAWTRRCYGALLRSAHGLLVHGESVILDATWTDSRLRSWARSVAAACAADLIELRLVAPELLAAGRILRRAQSGPVVSDADEQIRTRLAAEADPWPEAVPLDASRSPAAVAASAMAAAGWAPEVEPASAAPAPATPPPPRAASRTTAPSPAIAPKGART